MDVSAAANSLDTYRIRLVGRPDERRRLITRLAEADVAAHQALDP